MLNLLGFLTSYIYIILSIGLAVLFSKKEGKRRSMIIQLMLSPWWLIGMIFFEDGKTASIVPLSLLIAAYLFYRYPWFSKEGQTESEPYKIELVYYTFSLLLLTFLSFQLKIPYVATLGIFTMAYGNGLASIMDQQLPLLRYSKKRGTKSLGGSLGMFVVALLLSFVILFLAGHYSPKAIVTIALLATILEALTPRSLEKLTVPLGVFAAYYFFFL